MFLRKRQNNLWVSYVASCVSIIFTFSLIIQPQNVIAQSVMNLPLPGTMMIPSYAYFPAMLKGVEINLENPLMFDFIIDSGDSNLDDGKFRQESAKLVRYFLASLTTPEDQMWVNLSPTEESRIIPQNFGQTEMGRDLLAQDYILKQLTASLMYPEGDFGKEFWEKINDKLKDKRLLRGQELTTNSQEIVDTFNKVWIVPERAVVHEYDKGAFVMDAHLKVMLESDYLNRETSSVKREAVSNRDTLNEIRDTNSIIREIIIPELEREVNEGAHFSNLRQIYNSMILAAWYKQKLKSSLLGTTFVDQNKITGVNHNDPLIAQKIYQQYIETFKTGVYDYIKEEYDPVTQTVISKKYFSGGAKLTLENGVSDFATLSSENKIALLDNAVHGPIRRVIAGIQINNADQAILAEGMGIPRFPGMPQGLVEASAIFYKVGGHHISWNANINIVQLTWKDDRPVETMSVEEFVARFAGESDAAMSSTQELIIFLKEKVPEIAVDIDSDLGFVVNGKDLLDRLNKLDLSDEFIRQLAQLYYFSFRNYFESSMDDIQEHIRLALLADEYVIFLAVEDGVLNGFVEISFESDQKAAIIEFFDTRSAVRGLGYGNFLFEAALKYVQSKGSSQVKWTAMESSQEYYLKYLVDAGYVKDKDFYVEDDDEDYSFELIFNNDMAMLGEKIDDAEAVLSQFGITRDDMMRGLLAAINVNKGLNFLRRLLGKTTVNDMEGAASAMVTWDRNDFIKVITNEGSLPTVAFQDEFYSPEALSGFVEIFNRNLPHAPITVLQLHQMIENTLVENMTIFLRSLLSGKTQVDRDLVVAAFYQSGFVNQALTFTLNQTSDVLYFPAKDLNQQINLRHITLDDQITVIRELEKQVTFGFKDISTQQSILVGEQSAKVSVYDYNMFEVSEGQSKYRYESIDALRQAFVKGEIKIGNQIVILGKDAEIEFGPAPFSGFFITHIGSQALDSQVVLKVVHQKPSVMEDDLLEGFRAHGIRGDAAMISQLEIRKELAEVIMAVKNQDQDRSKKIKRFNIRSRRLLSSQSKSITFSIQKNNQVQIQQLESNRKYKVELKEDDRLGMVIYFTSGKDIVGVVIDLDEVQLEDKKKKVPYFSEKSQTYEDVDRLLKEHLIKEELVEAVMAVEDQGGDRSRKIKTFNMRKNKLTSTSSGITFSVQANNYIQIESLDDGVEYEVELKEDDELGLVIYFKNVGDIVGAIVSFDEVQQRDELTRITYFLDKGQTYVEVDRLLKKMKIKKESAEVIMAVKNQDKNKAKRISEFNEGKYKLLSTQGGEIAFAVQTYNKVRVERLDPNAEYEIEFREDNRWGLLMYLKDNSGIIGVIVDLDEIQERDKFSAKVITSFYEKGQSYSEVDRLLLGHNDKVQKHKKEYPIKKELAEVVMAFRNQSQDRLKKIKDFNAKAYKLVSTQAGDITFMAQINNSVRISKLEGDTEYELELKEDDELGLVIYFKSEGGNVGVVVILNDIQEQEIGQPKRVSYFSAKGFNLEDIRRDLFFKQMGWELMRARQLPFQPSDFHINVVGSRELDPLHGAFLDELESELTSRFNEEQRSLFLDVSRLIIEEDLSFEEAVRQVGISLDERDNLEKQWTSELPRILEPFNVFVGESQRQVEYADAAMLSKRQIEGYVSHIEQIAIQSVKPKFIDHPTFEKKYAHFFDVIEALIDLRESYESFKNPLRFRALLQSTTHDAFTKAQIAVINLKIQGKRVVEGKEVAAVDYDELIEGAFDDMDNVDAKILAYPLDALLALLEYKLSQLDIEGDHAMSAPGGIDLNPANLNLQTTEGSLPFGFPQSTPELIEQMNRATGLSPVIINVVPITNLPLLLGLLDYSDSQPVVEVDLPEKSLDAVKNEDYQELSLSR